jgi:uncharacterized membrane protein YtjA (UPF0391 family)
LLFVSILVPGPIRSGVMYPLSGGLFLATAMVASVFGFGGVAAAALESAKMLLFPSRAMLPQLGIPCFLASVILAFFGFGETSEMALSTAKMLMTPPPRTLMTTPQNDPPPEGTNPTRPENRE